MNPILKNKKVVLVVASNGFQQLEYSIPKKLLETEGITVITASDGAGGAVASDGATALVDITLDALNPLEYDGVFFIGGSGALEHLDNSTSYHIISQAKKHKIPYGAICISSRILAKAYGLDGIRATGWNGDNALDTIFKSFKAILVDRDIVIDKLVVTASGPEAAAKFGQGILYVLEKNELSNE